MSCRQAVAKTRSAAPTNHPARLIRKSSNTEDTEKSTEGVRAFLLIRNDGHLSRLERLHEPARLRQVELLVARLDAEEKPVAARERESRDVEHRVIRLRQPIERSMPDSAGSARPRI